MELTWATVLLLGLLLILNILSFLNLLLQREQIRQQRPAEIIQIRNNTMSPNEIRDSWNHAANPLYPTKPILLDRGRRLIYNGKDYQRVEQDQVIATDYGDMLYVTRSNGGDQEYLKPCGQFVDQTVDPLMSTFCVLPDNHRYKKHIDKYGNKK